MHMHTEPGWLRSYAEEILSGTVLWLLVFPAEYKPLTYSPMRKKPITTNARSVVIMLYMPHEIFLCSRYGIPFVSNLEEIYSTQLGCYFCCLGDQSCSRIDQWFWSDEIIGIAKISMQWWMIDNTTTAIDQLDIADKTPPFQPYMAICIYCSSLQSSLCLSSNIYVNYELN